MRIRISYICMCIRQKLIKLTYNRQSKSVNNLNSMPKLLSTTRSLPLYTGTKGTTYRLLSVRRIVNAQRQENSFPL